VFLTATLTGLRCCELQGSRWRDVSLTERTLRIVESKSEDGRRLVGFGEALADELEQHYRRTTFKGDDERVFVSGTGSKYWVDQYRTPFKKALAKAGIDRRVRPLHDARHGALTAMASNGAAPVTLMTVAGHASMQTTKRYLHLAGVVFHDDAAKLEARQLSAELSTALSEPEVISPDPSGSESGLET
jgi:integrase/recombinase XerD